MDALVAEPSGRMHRVNRKRVLEVASFDAHLRGLILPMGLRIDSVKISGDHLKCGYKPLEVEADQPGTMEVFVSDTDLASFLNAMPGLGLKNVTVEAKDGALHLKATKTVLIEMKAHVVCSLKIENRRQLFVQLESVDIMGVGPKQLIQAQLDKINPVVDVADFPIPANLESVQIVSGGIFVKGTIESPS